MSRMNQVTLRRKSILVVCFFNVSSLVTFQTAKCGLEHRRSGKSKYFPFPHHHISADSALIYLSTPFQPQKISFTWASTHSHFSIRAVDKASESMTNPDGGQHKLGACWTSCQYGHNSQYVYKKPGGLGMVLATRFTKHTVRNSC